MNTHVRPEMVRFLRGSFAGACLIASGFLCTPTSAQARDFGFGFSDNYTPRSYFPSSRYYSRDYFGSGRSYDDYSGGPRVDRLKAQTAEKLKKAPVPPPTKGPLMVVVSIAKQHLTVYDDGVPFLHSKVSTGSRGHETPTGVFAVIQKARWHRSNLYSDAPMPFMQRITWSGVAMHAGLLPGYPASHGCIRLPEEFAIRLWRTTQTGARVIVVQDDIAPAEIAHPVLFVRKAAPAVASLTIVPPVANATIGLRASVDTAKANAPLTTPDNTERADKTDAAQVKVADISVVRAGQTIGAASFASDRSMASASADPAGALPSAATPSSLQQEKPIAREAPLAATPAPLQASQPSLIAQAPAPAMQPPAAPALQSPPSVPLPAAPSVAPERTLRPGPVSVFISRKERKLFVRKGFEPLFEAPVTIKDADRAIGTHVFTALAQNADDTMRWNVLTVPNGRADRRAETPVRFAARKKHGDKETATDALASPPAAPTEAAKEALDRIEMPADAVSRISELMSVGASLIVTDEGLGPETGQETDFVVLTKDRR